MQYELLDIVEKDAAFSPYRQYRYDLIREWDKTKDTCLFICLNPSTADETTDDPTITRCINYTRAWGSGRFVMCNLFAWRATDPQDMKSADHPVSEPLNQGRNDETILQWTKIADKVICAWGNPGIYIDRGKQVFKLIEDHCSPLHLKSNQSGQPVHPLYQPKDIEPKPFSL